MRGVRGRGRSEGVGRDVPARTRAHTQTHARALSHTLMHTEPGATEEKRVRKTLITELSTFEHSTREGSRLVKERERERGECPGIGRGGVRTGG